MKDLCYLGDYCIDFSSNKISVGSKQWQVEPKLMAVLACLIHARGEVVTKDILLETAWPDTVATQDVLTRAISELRKIFGDNPKEPRFIETIYKKGYRLLATPKSEDQPPAIQAMPIASHTPEKIPNSRNSGSRWLPFLIGAAVIFGGGLWLTAPWKKAGSPTVLADLARPIPVTSLAGHEYRSPISPDGHRIAFIWGGEDPESAHHIYLKTIDEEGVHQFTQGPGFVDFPAWSPDGKYLAFTRSSRQGSELLIKPVIGGEERMLLRIEGSFFGLDWSPDGQRLAYGAATTPIAPYQIFTFSLQTYQATPVSFPTGQIQGDSGPIWHRDGQGLAFIRSWNLGGENDVFWVALDPQGQPTDQPKQLTFDRLPIAGISWLPDEQGLIMITHKDGYSNLSQWSPKSSVVKSIPVSPGFLMDPYVDPNGTCITFTQKSSEQNIWTQPLTAQNDEGKKQLIFSTYPDLSPIVSPTGNHIAWISLRSGYREIWVADAMGQKPQQVSRFEGGHLESPKWAPDGESVLVTFTQDGRSEISQVPIHGGKATFLTDASSKEALGFLPPNSPWLYFTSNRKDGWQVWRKHLQTKEVEQVTTHGGYASAMTAQGDLIYTKFGIRGIWKQPADGGDESLLVENFLPRDYGLWLIRDDSLYYLIWKHGHHELYRQNLNSGEREWVTQIGWIGWEPQGFSLSQDGSHLIFGQCEKFESDIMMVKLAKR